MSEKYRLVPFYNGVSSFKAAFPQLSDALIEWRELRGRHDEARSDFRKTGFRRGNFTQGVVTCSNPVCHEGGYEIDKLVADMLRQGQSERTGVLLCSGREVLEESRRGPTRCPHRIEYRATLTVRTGDEPGEQEQRGDRRRRFRRRGNRQGGRRPNAA